MRSKGFAPIADRNSRLLVLGSLPGRTSLEKGEYYAMPHNAFWWILSALVGFDRDASYAERRRALLEAGIAVWDVCDSAHRTGSLDSAIRPDSIVINDFASFLARRRGLEAIYFNGATAANLYRRRVLPTLPERLRAIPSALLPSTSPAHAGMSRAEKLARWSTIARHLR